MAPESAEREFGRLEERSENQERSINDLYGKVAEISKCIKRIERQSWIVMGERAGMAIVAAFFAAKYFGVMP